MSQRLLVESERLDADQVVATEDDYHYLIRVLRAEIGDRVTLFDGSGVEADAEVTRVGPRAAELRIVERRRVARAPGPEVTLLMGLAKGDKLDLVVQKATELGAANIVPVITARAVPRVEAIRAVSRRARWQKIAREAARQCGRADVPDVAAISEWTRAVEAAPPDAIKLLFWEEARNQGLRRTLPPRTLSDEALDFGAPPLYRRIVVAVGPEGGFTENEVDQAKRAGFAPVGLGPRILRAETAAIAALAVLGYALGDLGG